MRNAPITSAVLSGALLLVGCSEWPRSAHLEGESDLVSTSDDPRQTIHPSWTRVDETEPDSNDHTVQARQPYPLAVQTPYDATGYLIRGALDGLSWDADHEHEPFVNDEDEACEGVEGVPFVLDELGDHGGDRDFFLLDVEEDGGLCAIAEFPDTEETLGVDLLLMNLDSCSLPETLAMDPDAADEPLGYFMDTSYPVEWSEPVAAGDLVAVLLTGFVRRDDQGEWDWSWEEGEEASIAYRLGLSIVPLVDGEPALCPLLEEPS